MVWTRRLSVVAVAALGLALLPLTSAAAAPSQPGGPWLKAGGTPAASATASAPTNVSPAPTLSTGRTGNPGTISAPAGPQ